MTRIPPNATTDHLLTQAVRSGVRVTDGAQPAVKRITAEDMHRIINGVFSTISLPYADLPAEHKALYEGMAFNVNEFFSK